MQTVSKNFPAEFLNDKSAVAYYLEDIKSSHKLTAAEEKILAGKIRAGDREALAKMINANLKFVVAVCHNYEHQGLPMADLINEGNLGLIEAARRFDETLGYRFISYAVWWIRQAIVDALAYQARSIRLSPSVAMSIQQIKKASQRLTQSTGRAPSAEELELETGLRAERIRQCQELDVQPLSMNYNVGGESEFQDMIVGHSESRTERTMELSQARNTVQDIMERLNPREREIINLSYGINDGPMLSLSDIAGRFSLSRERIRQIKKNALMKLKRAIKKELSCVN